MRVSEVMTSNVQTIDPNTTIQRTAQLMRDLDVGMLPVGENDRLVGMITDRDIAIRGVGMGAPPDCAVREIMTRDVKYCFLDQDIDEITNNMAEIQVRRLPVLDRDKRLVGIIALGDIATSAKHLRSAMALEGISKPGGQHTTDGGGHHAAR